MFTDKKHSKRAMLACLLGVCGLAAFVYDIVRVYLAGGEIRAAQTMSLAIALLYGLTGVFLCIWTLVRGETFKLSPVTGLLVNGLLLAGLAGLIVYGLT